MQTKNIEWHFTVSRGSVDRRIAAMVSPPYLTNEGITLVDRRESEDRRVLKNMVDFYSAEKFNFFTSVKN